MEGGLNENRVRIDFVARNWKQASSSSLCARNTTKETR